jgi:hypothetical protein
MKAFAAAVALAAFTASTASGQSASSSATPTVRVQLRTDSMVQGFLRGNSADELVIFTSDRAYRHVPLSDVQRLEIRQRTGTHARRGAVMGVFLWASIMFAASIDRLEDAGAASWESAAILAGSAGLGALIGKAFPRYGWVETEPGRLTGTIDAPPARLTLRF